MKRTINTFRTLLIALWPATFLLISGFVELKSSTMMGRTFNPGYNILPVPFYIFSGIVFVFSNFHEKEFYARKSTVLAYIIATISVILICILWIARRFADGIFINRIIPDSLIFVNISISSFVLGYTLYSAIKAVILYKK